MEIAWLFDGKLDGNGRKTLRHCMEATLKHFFTNYKTSLCGIAAGALNLLANGLKPSQVALSAAAALLGLFAHD